MAESLESGLVVINKDVDSDLAALLGGFRQPDLGRKKVSPGAKNF